MALLENSDVLVQSSELADPLPWLQAYVLLTTDMFQHWVQGHPGILECSSQKQKEEQLNN